jgi:hypothetical protein
MEKNTNFYSFNRNSKLINNISVRLSKRTKHISWNGYCSDVLSVEHGVPLLGQTPFSIYYGIITAMFNQQLPIPVVNYLQMIPKFIHQIATLVAQWRI